MRRSISILVAAAMAVTGAIASFTPAQATTARVAPAVNTHAAADTGIVKVLDERNRWRGHRRGNRYHGYYRPDRHYYRPDRHYYRYPKYRRHYGYYHQPRRYYRSSPGFTFGFSFGGPSYYRY